MYCVLRLCQIDYYHTISKQCSTAPVSVSNHSHSSNKVKYNYANNNCNYSNKSIYCAIDTA